MRAFTSSITRDYDDTQGDKERASIVEEVKESYGNERTSMADSALSCNTNKRRGFLRESITNKRCRLLSVRGKSRTDALRTHVHYTTADGIVYEEVSNQKTITFWRDKRSSTFVTFYKQANRSSGQVSRPLKMFSNQHFFLPTLSKTQSQRPILDLAAVMSQSEHYIPLHPAIQYEEVLQEIQYEALEGDRHLSKVMDGWADYHCKFHSCIKLDGTPQELPVYTIHCNRGYKTSPEAKDKIGRFDFVQLNVTEDVIPDGARATDIYFAQVAAILSVTRQNACVGVYLLCMWMEELHAGNGPEWADLTPACVRYLTYQRNRNNKVHRQLIKVDHVLSPGLVVPLSCTTKDLSRRSTAELLRMRFSAIDCQFFSRGGAQRLPLYHYLQCKDDNFPKNRKKVLPFYLFNNTRGISSPSSEELHSDYLPGFVTSSFTYGDNEQEEQRQSNTDSNQHDHLVTNRDNYSGDSSDASVD